MLLFYQIRKRTETHGSILSASKVAQQLIKLILNINKKSFDKMWTINAHHSTFVNKTKVLSRVDHTHNQFNSFDKWEKILLKLIDFKIYLLMINDEFNWNIVSFTALISPLFVLDKLEVYIDFIVRKKKFILFPMFSL